jgi:2,6-dihydroxypseudooxynicotine hydrolase
VSWAGGSLIASPEGLTLAGPVLADRPEVLTAECDLPRARDKRINEHNDLMADRRPDLYEHMSAGPRVAGTFAHWMPRFIANGTDYADVQAVLSRVRRWDDWPAAWQRTASEYHVLAEAAEQDGRLATAGEAWRRAALCWHWAGFAVTDPGVPPQPGKNQPEANQLEANQPKTNAVSCFERGAATLTPPAQRVSILYHPEPLATFTPVSRLASAVSTPYGGTLAAYLRVPDADARPPAVIMLPGLDSVKEELQATAEYLLRRGLAVIAVDGPGQGEAAGTLPIEPAYERVATAIVDYLRTREDVDAERIGVFGVSLGGYYAARSVAHEPRLRAGVALAGPYRFDLDWDRLPQLTRDVFQHRSGAASAAQARQRAGLLTLAQAAGRITRPLLVVHGGEDGIVPVAHAERLAREAPGAELLVYLDGNHGLTNRAFESRSHIADWLAARLS